MARKLVVEIVGDASSLEREFKRSAAGAKRFERGMSQVGRGAATATVGFHGLGRAVGFASAQFLGGAGVVYGIKSTIDAAMESQRVLAQTRNAVQRSGLSWKDYSKQIDATLQSQSNLSAFDDEELSGTFANLVRRTGDVSQALRLNALSADVARGRNMDLAAAQSLVLKASIGNIGGLRRLGLNIDKNATATQALDLLQRKYAGSAAAYGRTAAGSMDRFRVSIENAQEKIGNALLPTIADLSTQAANWLNKPGTQKSLADNAQTFADGLGEAAKQAGNVKDTVSAILSFSGPPKWWQDWSNEQQQRYKAWRNDLAYGGTFGIFGAPYALPPVTLPQMQKAPKGAFADLFPDPLAGVADAVRNRGKGAAKAGGGATAATPYLSYQLAIEEARKGNAGDESVLRQIIAVLRTRLAGTKNLKASTELQNALNQYNDQLSGLLGEDAGVVKDAADKAKAARQARREKARAAAQAARELRMVYETPLSLQLAEARSGAQWGHGGRDVLIAIRKAARKALRSGNLLVQGQIDAWNTIASANQRLADMNKSKTSRMITAYHATSAAMAHGGAQLDKGAAGVLGQPVILQLDGRTIATAVVPHIQRSTRRSTATTTGRSAGTVHGI